MNECLSKTGAGISLCFVSQHKSPSLSLTPLLTDVQKTPRSLISGECVFNCITAAARERRWGVCVTVALTAIKSIKDKSFISHGAEADADKWPLHAPVGATDRITCM